MPAKRQPIKPLLRILARSLLLLVMAGVVLGLALWLLGVFKNKIPPGSQKPAVRSLAKLVLVPVRYIERPRLIPAVGTIRSIHPVIIAARIVGRVVWTNLEVGGALKKGEVIVKLDDRQLQAELAQATAAVHLARAELHQARIDQHRDKTLLVTGDVTNAAMDVANTAVATAQAKVVRALAARQTAQTVLGYATVRSPVNGVVMQKMVSVGDTVVPEIIGLGTTVLPGSAVARVYDPHRLQLAAVVPESLAARLYPGEKMALRLAGVKAVMQAKIRQVVPRVSVQSRSFIVKATAKFPAGVWPGMYGTLLVPVGTEHLLVIPQAALGHAGQLALVHIKRGGRVLRQVVQPGRHIGNLREILSGLHEGESVVLPMEVTTRPTEAAR